MPKTITSPVKEFPGTVILPDYLTMPQALAYERAIRDGSALMEQNATPAEYDALTVEAICECVQEWNLDGFEQLAPDTFPFTPRLASTELINWLFSEIIKLYNPEIPE